MDMIVAVADLDTVAESDTAEVMVAESAGAAEALR